MEPTYFAQYRGFEFQCSPERIDAYTFAPRLVIREPEEAMTIEIALESAAPLSNPTAAAHLAFAHGRRWVDGGYDAAVTSASGRAPLAIEGSSI